MMRVESTGLYEVAKKHLQVNKLPQIVQLKGSNIYYLTEAAVGFLNRVWLRVSHKVKIELLAGAAIR